MFPGDSAVTATLNLSLYAFGEWRNAVRMAQTTPSEAERYSRLAALWQMRHITYQALYFSEIRP
jgi:hypothetical protein